MESTWLIKIKMLVLFRGGMSNTYEKGCEPYINLSTQL